MLRLDDTFVGGIARLRHRGGLVNKSRFTEDQIRLILREWGAGARIGTLTCRHGVTDQTLYVWRARYGRFDINLVKRLRALEQHNRRLKRRLADQAHILRAGSAEAGAQLTLKQRTLASERHSP